MSAIAACFVRFAGHLDFPRPKRERPAIFISHPDSRCRKTALRYRFVAREDWNAQPLVGLLTSSNPPSGFAAVLLRAVRQNGAKVETNLHQKPWLTSAAHAARRCGAVLTCTSGRSKTARRWSSSIRRPTGTSTSAIHAISSSASIVRSTLIPGTAIRAMQRYIRRMTIESAAPAERAALAGPGSENNKLILHHHP